MLSASTWSRARRRQRGDVEHAAPLGPAKARDPDIVGDRLLADQAVAAILRHQTQPERHRGVGAADRHLAAVDQDRARPPAVPGAVDRERRLDAAGAEQPEEADHLAVADAEIEPGDPHAARPASKTLEPAHLERDRARRAAPDARPAAGASPIISATTSCRVTAPIGWLARGCGRRA